jgi:hypothetical protein
MQKAQTRASCRFLIAAVAVVGVHSLALIGGTVSRYSSELVWTE